jgi:hypothetical protein
VTQTAVVGTEGTGAQHWLLDSTSFRIIGLELDDRRTRGRRHQLAITHALGPRVDVGGGGVVHARVCNLAWNLESSIVSPRGSVQHANLELGTWNQRLRTEEQVHISRPNTQTTAYESTHKVLAHLFLAHEGPNPLCTVVVIATT